MKIRFALLELCFFSLANAQTNHRKWDIRVSSGGGTYPYLQSGGHYFQLNLFSTVSEKNTYATEALYQTGNRHIKLGVSIAHTNIVEYTPGSINFTGYEPGYLQSKQKVFAVMPTFNYSYLIRKNSSLYSEFSFGAAFLNKQFYDNKIAQNSIQAAFQCTALGYRLGKRFGVFAELGYGYKGILQLGVSGSF